MLAADEEEERQMEEVFSRIWKEQEGASCSSGEIQRALRDVELKIRPSKLVWYRPSFGIVACWLLSLVVMGITLYFYQKTVTPTFVQEKVTYKQCYASIGTRECVTLPDSSVVWLNAGSLLVYPSTFTDSRNVYLMGEGYFDVRKDQSRPFVVMTGHLALRVLGTTFNLSAYPECSQLEATLETGCVTVTILANEKEYILYPNEQLVYIPSTQTVRRKQVNAIDYSEWRKGGLYFNDMLLKDVFDELERTYGIKMHMYSSAYQNQRIRVRFNKDESLDNVLRIIQQLVPNINYKMEGRTVYWK